MRTNFIMGILPLLFVSLVFSQMDTARVFVTRTLSHDTVYFDGANAYGPYNTISTVTLQGRATNDSTIINQKYDIIFVTDNSGTMLRSTIFTDTLNYPRNPGDRKWGPPGLSRIQCVYNACVNFIDSFADPDMQFGHMYYSGVVGTSIGLSTDTARVKAKLDTSLTATQMVNGIHYPGTATFTAIHDAVRYISKNYRRNQGVIPVIIALTDGDDNASGNYSEANVTRCSPPESAWGYCPSLWPGVQPNLGTTRPEMTDSVTWIIDSVRRAGVDLRVFTINIGLGDSTYMRQIAQHGTPAGSPIQWARSFTGSDLGNIFTNFWGLLKDTAAVAINATTPMLVDVLAPGIRFADNVSYVNTANYVVPTRWDTATVNGLTTLSFTLPPIKLDQRFEIHYDIAAARTTLGGGPETKLVNNSQSDNATNYSRVQYRDVFNVPITASLSHKYITVLSIINGVALSTRPDTFADAGSVYSLLFSTTDTAKYNTTLYAFQLERATGVSQYLPVNAYWSFGPMAGWITNPPNGFAGIYGTQQAMDVKIVGDSSLAGQRSVKINLVDGATTYTDSLILDAINIGTPPQLSFIITSPASPVAAGQPAAITITPVDQYNNPITDPSLTMGSRLCLIVDTTTVVSVGGTLDTLYAGQSNCMDNPFPNGTAFISDFITFVSGDNTVRVTITHGNNETWNGSFTLTIVPGVPDHIIVVRQSDPSKTPVIFDTLSSGGAAQTSQTYVAMLYDRYGNLITDVNVTNQVQWGITGLPDRFSVVGNSATYNANGITSGGLGTATATYNVGGVYASQAFQIVVLPIIGVGTVSTHEWVPDTSSYEGLTEISTVLLNVLNVDPGTVQNEFPGQSLNMAMIHKLQTFGFNPYRDGYLDYLNIGLSDTFTLLDQHIAVVRFHYTTMAGAADSISWADSVVNNGITIQRRKVVPIGADKRAYRLWLVPNSLNNTTLETGATPSIYFDNSKITHTGTRLINGAAFPNAFTEQDNTIDSAPPVLHRFLYQNNACFDQKANEVKISFSEPIQWTQPPSFNTITSFVLINGGSKDSSFMGTMALSGVNAFEALEDKLTWNYLDAGDANRMMTYRVEVPQGVDQNFQIGRTLLRFALNDPLLAFKDLSNNIATTLPNREIVLESKGPQQTVCGFNGNTVVSRYEAIQYSWGTDPATNDPVPQFPYFGFTVNLSLLNNSSTGFVLVDDVPYIQNPARHFYCYGLDSTKIVVTAWVNIFDVFGNLTASPATNPSLWKGFTASNLMAFADYASVGSRDSTYLDSMYFWTRPTVPGAPDTLRPKFSSTTTIGYDYMITHCAPSTDIICVPSWNCVNGKGRLVAPGGYIATVTIESPSNTLTEVRKLLVTSGHSATGF